MVLFREGYPNQVVGALTLPTNDKVSTQGKADNEISEMVDLQRRREWMFHPSVTGNASKVGYAVYEASQEYGQSFVQERKHERLPLKTYTFWWRVCSCPFSAR